MIILKNVFIFVLLFLAQGPYEFRLFPDKLEEVDIDNAKYSKRPKYAVI